MSPSGIDEVLAALGESWRAAARAAGPSEREPVERAVRTLYRRAGLAEPLRILWAASPLEGAIAAYCAGRGTSSLKHRLAAELSLGGAARLERALGADAARVRATLDEGLCLEMTRAARREIAALPDPAASDRAVKRVRLAGVDAGTPPWALVWPEVVAGLNACGLGHYEAYRVGMLQVHLRLGGEAPGVPLDALAEIARGSGWWWAFPETCVLTELPLFISTNNEGRLHAEVSPAVEYRDGFSLYANAGTHVPSGDIREKHRREVIALLTERNTEIRRVMLERFGMDQLMRMGFARLVDTAPAGKLYRIAVDGRGIAVVQVVCPSTAREYLLTVPPWMIKAHDAVAWTFGMPPEQYAPVQET